MSDLLIGVQTQDIPSITVAGVEGAALNVAGLEIFAERGPDKVVRVRRYTDFPKHFGSFKTGYNGAYCVKGFYENLLNVGATLYVKRMVPSNAVEATNSISDSTVPKWKFSAGQMGQLDKGLWGNQLQVYVTDSSRSGSTIASDVVGNDTVVSIPVDSVAPFEVYDFISVASTPVFKAQILKIDEVANTLTVGTPVPTGTTLTADDAITVMDRTVSIKLKDEKTGIVEEMESYKNVTIDPQSKYYIGRKINDADNGSMYVYFTDLTTTVDVASFPVTTNATPDFTGGVKGTETLTPTEIAAEHQAFNDVEIRSLSNAEFFSESVWVDGETYCRVRGDCKWQGVPTYDVATGGFTVKEKWANRRRSSRKIYSWTVGTWIKVDDPIGLGEAPIKEIPNVGHVMGYDIYIKNLRGVHKVPASRKQTLVGVRGLVSEEMDRVNYTELGNIGYNEITSVGGNFAIRSARTPSKLKEWTWIHGLDMTIYFKKSFEAAFQDVENEPNKPALLASIVDAIRKFSQAFYVSSSNGGREGGYGNGGFGEVVKIVADSSINPKEKLSSGELRVNYYFSIPDVVEKLMIGVGLKFEG